MVLEMLTGVRPIRFLNRLESETPMTLGISNCRIDGTRRAPESWRLERKRKI